MIEIAKKRVQNKMVHALRGGWILVGIAKKNCKNQRVYALKGRWTRTGIGKKVQKYECLCMKGRVDNDWNF